jgi:TonB-dependent SusC/RagA subfamily outer membrane receptor
MSFYLANQIFMRKIFTLCMLLFSFETIAQLPVKFDTPINNQERKNVMFSCRAPLSVSPDPLLIINGVASEFKRLGDIDTANIESITILKEDNAFALYGNRGMSGVIIITTKSSQTRKIHIKDMIDGSNIRAATVCFVSVNDRRDTLMFTANDSGVVNTDRLKKRKEYSVTIISAGYTTLHATYTTTDQATCFILERRVVNCSPVVVSTSGCWRRCRRVSCELTRVSDCNFLFRENVTNEVGKSVSAVSVFPNPIQRGGTITIEMNGIRETVIHIILINLAGQQLSFQKQAVHKGSNRMSVNIDSRWSTGINLLQLTDEKGNDIRWDKIIIQ